MFERILQTRVISILKDVLMRKIPLYIALVALALGAWGCTWFLAKPSLESIPQLTAEVSRIIERSEENSQAMKELSVAILELDAKLKAEEPSDEAILRAFSDLREKASQYDAGREEVIKSLYMYLGLSLEEYEAIFKVLGEDLPEDHAKVIQKAKERIKEAREKMGE